MFLFPLRSTLRRPHDSSMHHHYTPQISYGNQTKLVFHSLPQKINIYHYQDCLVCIIDAYSLVRQLQMVARELTSCLCVFLQTKKVNHQINL